MMGLREPRQLVGIIGLGSLGLPVALNISKGGFDILGIRRRHGPPPAAPDLRIAGSVAEIGTRCDIILTCLPSADILAQVISGPEGLSRVVRADTVIVDLGTTSIAIKVAQHEALKAAGASMLDCGVSGNSRYIESRSAALFVSGSEHDFQRCASVLRSITDHVSYVGAFGAGTTLKQIASILVPIHTLAAAEALALASRVGLDLRTVHEAISGTQASSAMFESRGERMLERDFGGPSLRGYFQRNLEMALDTARSSGGHYPLLEAVHACYRRAINEGYGELDQAGIFEYLMKRRD